MLNGKRIIIIIHFKQAQLFVNGPTFSLFWQKVQSLVSFLSPFFSLALPFVWVCACASRAFIIFSTANWSEHKLLIYSYEFSIWRRSSVGGKWRWWRSTAKFSLHSHFNSVHILYIQYSYKFLQLRWRRRRRQLYRSSYCAAGAQYIWKLKTNELCTISVKIWKIKSVESTGEQVRSQALSKRRQQ